MEFITVFIPVLIAIAIALKDEYARKSHISSILLTITSVLVVIRFCIVALHMGGMKMNTIASVTECISSLYIMPFMYMYLCDQCGTERNNADSKVMLALPLVTLLHYTVDTDGNNGVLLLRNYVVTIQCLIIGYCMIRLWFRIKQYGLQFSRNMIIYFVWMFMLLIFTAYSFMMKIVYTNNHAYYWAFFIYYTIVLTAGYLLVPYSFKVSPIVTTDEGRPVKLDSFIKQTRHLAEKLHILMDEEHIYLQPSVKTDDVARMLGTNRTYVTRLMRQEYNKSLTDFMNEERIKHSQELLRSTSMNLEEIAEKSGFQSSSNYCRVFKHYTSLTPIEWKEVKSE